MLRDENNNSTIRVMGLLLIAITLVGCKANLKGARDVADKYQKENTTGSYHLSHIIGSNVKLNGVLNPSNNDGLSDFGNGLAPMWIFSYCPGLTASSSEGGMGYVVVVNSDNKVSISDSGDQECAESADFNLGSSKNWLTSEEVINAALAEADDGTSWTNAYFTTIRDEDSSSDHDALWELVLYTDEANDGSLEWYATELEFQ